MINPVAELRDFAEAALLDPVPRDHWESDARFRRRRVVAVITLVLGAIAMAWALRIEAGDPLFYVGTIVLGAIWGLGALVSGRLHLGWAHTREGDQSRGIVQAFVLGALLLGIFLAGSVVVAQIPVLRGPVDELLDHARFGSLPLVIAITAFNGITEEMYFRGALYAAVGREHAVAITTVVYALVTALSGIPLLVLAGAMLGVVTGMQRRVTGGLLGPTITHLTWSIGMLLLLPGALELFG